jgi:hypothetical protein
MRDALRAPIVEVEPGQAGRALVLSMRRLSDLVGFVAVYEFEDVVVDALAADLGSFADVDQLEGRRRLYKLARYVTGSPRVADSLRVPGPAFRIEKDYDLFLPVFNHPYELFALSAVEGWRKRCRFAACYLCEAWDAQMPRYLVEMLRDFDHVFVGVKTTVDTVQRVCGRPCTYLPMGVDTLRFCPEPGRTRRLIDVCGIGRRSPVTHKALLDLSREKGIFYYYDTIRSGGATKNVTFHVIDPREHRMLLGNLLKRSRYFIANRAFADRPSMTRGKDEIAARFYEGAAAGTVMLGEPPDSDDFRLQFGWPDAAIATPFHAPAIAEVIAELDADPARVDRCRRESVVQSLLRHDWVYRLRAILEVAGIPEPTGLKEREARLRAAAEAVRRATAEL